MRLRTKLTALIALASVVPILAATLVGRELVRRSTKWEFARNLEEGRTEVEKRYRALQQEVTRAVQGLVSPEDQFIGAILIEVAKGGPDDETFRRMGQIAPRVMEERGLNVLTVVDPSGKILASGHFPGQMGDRVARARERRRPAARRASVDARAHPIRSSAELVKERVLEQGKPVTHLAMEVRQVARSPLGHQVTVVGGRYLGPALVSRLRLWRGTKVLVQDGRGQRLAGSRDWARYAGYPQERIVVQDPRGEQATITLAVPDDKQRLLLEAINFTAGALASAGLLLALILGALAARRLSRPLQELAEGAQAVAQGDLERQLVVRGRDEVGELMAAFNQMTADLKDSKERLVAAERVAAWQEIARRIAHEIKNPLFPIQTSIETLRKVRQKQHPDFEEIFDESTTTILEEVQRLKTIATEFSQFARMPKPSLAPCDLREVLGSVVTLYGVEVPVRSEVPEELPAVLGDREQLVQVFSNLVKNASEALAGREGRIAIRAAAREGWVEVAVEDNGPGLSEEVQANIFTPYFTTKGASGGSGLGLAIVHRIVSDHGGRIEARNVEAGGAVFIVQLPVAGSAV
jgi:two-component system nitrogen regulation sensor histidine kinase NtrY